MTKQEIEKAIENGESVWVALDDKVERLVNLEWFTDDVVKSYNMDIGVSHVITRDYFNHLYKTKAEAEHYLHHANITRTEILPFLTWEEFLKEMRLNFIACDGVSNMILYCCNNTIYLVDDEYPEFNTTSWELTEANFYKAYDECVRLFKGEE